VQVAGERFGEGVAISHDGNRALVTDVGKNRIYVFEREAGQWRQAPIIEGGPEKTFDQTGIVAISPDGSSIAAPIFFPSDMSVHVHVYRPCSCADGWQLVAELHSAKPPQLPPDDDGFGRALSFSNDGKTLAVGAWRDPGDASDNGTTINFGSEASGAVYIFAADDGGTWQRRAFLKAKTAQAFDQLGVQVALSGDGKVLLAGACGFAANANGLRRNHRADATLGPSIDEELGCRFGGIGGSGYWFEADGSGAWSHTAAAIAAPGERAGFGNFANTGIAHAFSLSTSADAQTSAFLVSLRTFVGKPDRVVVH